MGNKINKSHLTLLTMLISFSINSASKTQLKLTFKNNKKIFGSYQLSEAVLKNNNRIFKRPFKSDLTNIIVGKKDIVIISDTNKKGKLTSINFIKLPHTKKGKSYVAQTKALDGENGERFKDFIKNKIELSKNINLDSGHCNRFNQKVTCTFNLTN
ncbi:MAG: hypothetical protein GY909_13160 [Oligoflexia bacterium]|nr:hypothetical protein [Oligoflexia bacterium]